MKRQTDRNVTGFFQKLLELEDPWQVVAVELRDEDRSVEIEVEWPASYKASCPSAGGLARSTTTPRRVGGGIWTR